MKETNTYAIEYEILRADHEDELVESGELVLQGEDILDVILQAEAALLDPQEREEYKVKPRGERPESITPSITSFP